ncbi:MAG: AAA family ATPase [Gammaproteobacteria bacterium]|nr:AAA family ATPase [Gammaproteobacteria bacterium]
MGKTYLLKKFGQEYFSHYHYIDFEKERDLTAIFKPNLNPKRILDELSFYLKQPIDVIHDLIIFDEIQACPDALTSLKYFCEEMPTLALCAAGSLLGVHLNSGSYPVGKVDQLTLHPLSFLEFLEALGDDRALEYIQPPIDIHSSIPEIVHTHLWEQLKKFFIVGGLPEIVDYYRSNENANPTETLQDVRRKQNTLITAYYADMAKHSGKANAMHLDRIWHAVSTQLAQVQDGTSARFRFKDVVPGINRYSRLATAIDWLEGAGLIIKTYIVEKPSLPLAAFTKENIFKLYVFDIGILGAMVGIEPITIRNYNYGTYKGFFAENFVATEFINAGIKQLYSWRGKEAEIEFLRELDGQVIPVEVKSGSITQAKSLQAFSNKYQPPYAVIMSAKNLYINKIANVHYYPLYLASQVNI